MTEQEKNLLLEEAKQKFPINTVVSSTHGSRDTIKNHNFRFGIGASTKNNIYYDNGNTELYHYNSKTWAEVISKPEANLKVEALKPIETKFEYEVVHCTTQEEWDFIRTTTTKANSKKWCEAIKDYPAGVCIYSNGMGWSSLGFWKRQDSTKIYSFQEWCDKFNHKPDFKPKFEVMKEESLVGRYLKALVNNAENSQVIKENYYKIIGETNDSFHIYVNSIKMGLTKKLTQNYELMPIGFTPDNIIPEYVECLNTAFTNFTKGKIYKLDSEGNCQMDNGNFTKGSMQYPKDKNYLKPSTKEAYEAQFKSTDTNWIPKVGDWIVWKNDKTNKAYQLIFYNSDNKGFKVDHNHGDYLKGNIFSACRKAEPHEIPNDMQEVTKKTEYITLNESHVGKYVSLYYNSLFYDKVLVTKENGKIYLLNNCYSNNNGHKDKSVYKYSLCYDDCYGVNLCCDKITLLSDNNEVVLTPETYGYSSARYSISIDPITPKQAIKSIFDKDYSSPLNEVLELPKSSKKQTKQLIY
jgi:hypothetical protein